MATYAVQFITRDGALCAQHILNRGKAMLLVQSEAGWLEDGQARRCVVIVVTANSAMERLKLRATAVSQVFHERARAIEWLKQLGEEQ